MSLFQTSVIKKYLSDLSSELIDKKYTEFQSYFGNPERQENIRNLKEEEFQEGFIRELFVKIFEYTLNPEPNYNIVLEKKNVDDSKKADGAIIKENEVIAVIELKSTQTTDLSKVETQAFGYKNHNPKCQYIITSNFEKIRLYIQNAIDHLEFDLFNLTREDFALLWLCFEKDNILKDIPLKIKESSVLQEENVTKKLYNDYSKFRKEIFENIVKNNTEFDKLVLFKKTQKLLDRFLFIFFAEDRLLLPPNSISEIVKQWNDLKENYDEYFPLYERFKKYFGYLNTGFKGKKYDIFAYNGGLFLPDKILDNIKIDDEVLYQNTVKLSTYDFETDVDVNILGHIFEHSLGEIETVQAEIAGEVIDTQKTKRKKDGIFYTPKYITKYIVENTVGKLCEKKRTEFGIIDEEYAKGRKNRKKDIVRALDDKLTAYRDWLIEITILDPACGSGAFLNQALEFLIQEHKKIDELKFQLLGGSIVFPDIEAKILEKNIYGVDLNEESVEIAKLSLWLRTAQKGRKLTTLSNHIKCGNSLIDDSEIAGEKAFNWQNEFSEVFEKGGFDVVIGNPPYVPAEYISEKDKLFLEEKYNSAFGRINLYPVFYEKGISILKKQGVLGFITPYTILKNQYYKEARKFILENTDINVLIDFKGVLVFEDAAVDSIILILTKDNNSKNEYCQVSNIRNFINSEYDRLYIKQSEIFDNEDLSLVVSVNDEFIEKITQDCVPLKEIVNFKQGIITGSNKNFLTNSPNKLTKQVLTGSDFNKYSLKKSSQFIIYDCEKLHRPRVPEIFEVEEKILLRQTGAFPICTIDSKQHYTLDTIHNGKLINDDFYLRYILALLNSKLFRFLYENQINETGKVFAQVKIIYIDPLPVKKISRQSQQYFIEKADELIAKNIKIQDKKEKFFGALKDNLSVEKLSSKLESFNKFDFKSVLDELKKIKISLPLSEQSEWKDFFELNKNDINLLQIEINKTIDELDQMVYELYGMNKEEIRIVEETI